MNTTLMKLLLSLLTLTITLSSFGQAPEGFNYQAVIRDASSNILTNQAVGMQMMIRQGSPGGTPVYTETFSPTTNGYGLVNLEIGSGVTVDDFTLIDWANGPFFIETAVDVTGGVAYMVMGTSQLMSVPYALYAKSSGSSVPGPQGPAGNDGNDGVDGAQGIQGVPGSDGADGIDGSDGVIGLQGISGNDGTNGTDGAAGAQGIQGIPGNDGIDGTNGVDGAQGVPGSDGANGIDGAVGPQGIQGVPGNDGVDGLDGDHYKGTSSSVLDWSTLYSDCAFTFFFCLGNSVATLTTNEALAYTVGMRVLVVAASDPNVQIEGVVISYIAGIMNIQIDYMQPSSYSGPMNDWIINLGVLKGAQGQVGAPGPPGSGAANIIGSPGATDPNVDVSSPAQGDEWVNSDTGERYIYDGAVWELAPGTALVNLSDVDASGVSDYDLLMYDNGVWTTQNYTPGIGTAGATTSDILMFDGLVWMPTAWLPARNWMGSSPSPAIGSNVMAPGMTRFPMDGDQWTNQTTGISYIYSDANGWEILPSPTEINLSFSNGGNNIGNLGAFIGQGNVSSTWGDVEQIIPETIQLMTLRVTKDGTSAGVATVYIGGGGIGTEAPTVLTVVLPAGDGASGMIDFVVPVSQFDRISVFMNPDSGSWNYGAASVTMKKN